MAVKGNKTKNDRVGQYLTHLLDDYEFDMVSDSYINRVKNGSMLKDVPVPFEKKDLTGKSITGMKIARNMVFVMGCDPTFRYAKNYLAFIQENYPKDIVKPVLGEGAQEAEQGHPENACALFRGALVLEPDSKDAMYMYGRACVDAYNSGDGEDYIGTFKAEALRMFEELTLKYPDFDGGYYYLGFAYLNLGLYTKAQLTFKVFMQLAEKEDADADRSVTAEDLEEAKKEVSEILEKLREPVKIEAGCNDVISGRYERGIAALVKYEDDERFNTYWPLWYYLGIAYEETGDADEAVRCLKEVLRYSPSNRDAMKELADIYQSFGNAEMAEKYRHKIEIVDRNAELDKELKENTVPKGVS
jgi:tetratricopeptide (TPR) repeat protein